MAQQHQLEKNEKHMKKNEQYMKHYAKHYAKQQSSEHVNTPTETVFEVNSYVLLAYPNNSFTKRPRPPHKLMCE